MKQIHITISTENGTGSFTANKILFRALAKSGFYCRAKNLFPSNIAGLPTQYHIMLSSTGLQSFQSEATDLLVAFNKKTLEKDLKEFSKAKYIISNADFKQEIESAAESFLIPARKASKELHPSASVRKLLYNMLYVGLTGKLLGLPFEYLESSSRNLLSKLKEEALNANISALKTGYELIAEPYFKLDAGDCSYDHVFDGNSTSALGFLDGGAQVLSWYPITPSTSVAETFMSLNQSLNPKSEERSVLQCEDEISAITAALGAGWSGAKSLTATSGPGLSLMQEALGLAYFAEIPVVVLDVQRAGPSTGLPTRTAQGDLLMAHYSSHGDTCHPVLLPGTPQEAYDDAFSSLSLAQDLQSPVMILSDLDLGMNEWLGSAIQQKEAQPSKGKFQLQPTENFKRYSNAEEVSTRSLPGISDSSLAYFTRGSGHQEDGAYSEDPKVYAKKLSRLKDKISKQRELSPFVPKDLVQQKEGAEFSVCLYGSSQQIRQELEQELKDSFSYLRLRALPVDPQLENFFKAHQLNFVVEQNRDGQLRQILQAQFPENHFVSLCQYNGLPIDAHFILSQLKKALGKELEKHPRQQGSEKSSKQKGGN